MAKRGLGKGLSSLIPGADIETPASNNYTNTNIQTKEVVKLDYKYGIQLGKKDIKQ